ncbi:MAG: type I DNA topoisomerase [Deltaproteobacteria bacterium]|nr:type I DNA topoisomerase [Deltaproteobacteria bacterium]
MAHSLLIVESPTKVKTLKKYLGSDYEVKASLGHIKDLPKNKLGINIEADFEPTYDVIKERKKTITELKTTASKVDTILLASDPDREGEAIAWHIAEEIAVKGKKIYRVLFNDLTKNTVLRAIEKPQELDANKYEAQKTRRILDRLVGYQISPLLWEKVRRGLSAGRVQSVAVRIICEREKEILKFVSEEYWTITARLEGGKPPQFEARLSKIDGKKTKIQNETMARAVLDKLHGASFTVTAVDEKETERTPPPPFTTSKLQQEASRRLHFSAKKTMMFAQKLYEGIDLGEEGPVGLITYMRTDSVRIASDALTEVRDYILRTYGKAFLPQQARYFKTSKTAQDAHEAIRPASLTFKPDDIKPFLKRDEYRLYQLIWNRFIASQMSTARIDQTLVQVTAGNCLFTAQGSVITFPGFITVYTEGRDEENGADESDTRLPSLTKGEMLTLISLDHVQNFTQPPPRFSEATLVKELEDKGLGRPSTYAAILSTIQEREYVKLEKGRFHPTELGGIVNELLITSFPRIMDVAFTATMEDKLDRIETGTLARDATLKEFYESFSSELEAAKKDMRNLKREETPTDIVCDKCGAPMIIKWGRNGRFLACSGYPACKNTSNVSNNADGSNTHAVQLPATDIVCDVCGKQMVIKEGRFGKFLGCSGYPSCTSTKPFDIGIDCPKEGCGGRICEKRTKKGKVFFGCTRYPGCTYAVWHRPIPERCPQCDFPILVEKPVRGRGVVKACPNEDCGYRETS